jgi:hypothetical protein
VLLVVNFYVVELKFQKEEKKTVKQGVAFSRPGPKKHSSVNL